jgi:hypothetical protein
VSQLGLTRPLYGGFGCCEHQSGRIFQYTNVWPISSRSEQSPRYATAMAIKVRKARGAVPSQASVVARGPQRPALADAVREWASKFGSIRVASETCGVEYARLRRSLFLNKFYVDDLHRLGVAMGKPVEMLRSEFGFAELIGKRGARRVAARADAQEEGVGVELSSYSTVCDAIRRTARGIRGPVRTLQAHFGDIWRHLGRLDVVVCVVNELPPEWGAASPDAAVRFSQLRTALEHGARVLYVWPGSEVHGRNSAAGVPGAAPELFEARFREFRKAVGAHGELEGIVLGVSSPFASGVPGTRVTLSVRPSGAGSIQKLGFMEILFEGCGERELVLPLCSASVEALSRQVQQSVALKIESDGERRDPALEELYCRYLQYLIGGFLPSEL